MMKIIFIICAVAVVFSGCKQNGDMAKKKALQFEEVSKELEKLEVKNETADSESGETKPLEIINQVVRVVKTYPHDPSAYTQGLFFHAGFLYESTGLNGKSTLRKVEPESGKVVQQIKLPNSVFAEGIAFYNDKIYQLSWTSGRCFVYDFKTFKLETEYSYRGEGWGIAEYKGKFYMSNGTNKISILSPDSFNPERELFIKENNKPLWYVNELEFINNELWANIYLSKKIARIDPITGLVKAYIDLSPLYKYIEAGDNPEVLNGIAYDKSTNRIFLTGKYWKYIFEVVVESIEK